MKPMIILLSCLFTLNVMGQDDLNTARKLTNSEQYEEAEKVYQDLITKNPTNGDVYYYYGETVLKDYLSDTFSNSLSQSAKKAEQLFQTGIKQAPTNMLNQIGMGAVTLLLTNDTTKAIPYFTTVENSIPKKRKQQTPEHAVILTKLAAAQLYGKVNRFKKAIYYCEWAKKINPNDPNIYLTLGDVYIKENDASNALLNYNQALYKDPKSPLPKIKIGNIYMRVPNLNAARPYFEEAQQIDSTFAPVYRSLGELYSLAGRYDLAKENFHKYLELSGNNIPAKVRYGNSLFRSRDYAEALNIIREVLQVDKSRNYLNRLAAYCCYDKRPQELEDGLKFIREFFKNASEESIIPRDYAYYGRILYKLGENDPAKLDSAFIMLNKAYEMDPSDSRLLAEIALDNYYSKRYAGAVKAFKMKAAKGEAGAGDDMLIGKSYYSMGRYHKADSVFTAITGKQPDNLQAYLYLARTYTNMDSDFTQGIEVPKWKQLVAKASSDSVKNRSEMFEAFSALGYSYLKNNDDDNAKIWYSRLLNLDPTNKDYRLKAYNGLVTIAYKKKNYPEARDIYLKMLDLDPGNNTYKQAVTQLDKVIRAQKIQQEYK